MTDAPLEWGFTSIEAFSADSRARAWVIGCSDVISRGYVSRYKWGVHLDSVTWDEGYEKDPTEAQRKAETAMKAALALGWSRASEYEGQTPAADEVVK